MGQFGNQPDFATNDIKVIVPSDTIDRTTFLDASVVYIWDNTTLGNELKVIPAGVAGPFAISKFNSTNNGGQDYSPGANIGFATTTTGSGTGLTVDVVVANTALANILTIAVNTAGTGYENGDLVTITGGDANAVFRIVATAGLPIEDQAVTFKGLGTGGFLPVTVDYVLATGTTVAELIAAK